MNTPIIPLSFLQSLAVTPPNRHTAILLRHSYRETFDSMTFGDEANLTADGIRVAREVGELLNKRKIGRILTSPIKRCSDTALAIKEGAQSDAVIIPDSRLGDPGVFITDTSVAIPMFIELGVEGIVPQQVSNKNTLPGMRNTEEGIQILLELMQESADDSTIDIFVTHDSILAVCVFYLLGIPVSEENWPGFLEGLFVWRDSGEIAVVWRGNKHRISMLTENVD